MPAAKCENRALPAPFHAGLPRTVIRGMHVFPVRHHSPVCALGLARFLERRRIRELLIEGPSDAAELIDWLVHPDTRPPVAILAYRLEKPPSAVAWPFVAYSPEYQALVEAKRRGIPASFCDLPSGVVLAHPTEAPDATTPSETPASARRTRVVLDVPETVLEHLARDRDFQDFEEMWEGLIETGFESEEELLRATSLVGQAMREYSAGDRLDAGRERAREAAMMAHVAAAVARGVPPEEILVVCGAAHAPALSKGEIDFTALDELPPPAPHLLTLAPHSYRRLATLAGYGAGTRAPYLFQLLWEERGDWSRAAQRVLTSMASRLANVGFNLSVSDVLDACVLATILGFHRQKSQPTTRELAEAACTTLGHGHPERIEGPLQTEMIGDAIGRIAEGSPVAGLAREFYETLRAPGYNTVLLLVDQRLERDLNLLDPVHRRVSIFLHRLALAGVTYATLSGAEGAGGSIAGATETWQLKWQPLVDVQLSEAAVHGATIAEVADRLARDRLSQVSRLDAATELALTCLQADLAPVLAAAIDACERTSAVEGDFAVLARATVHLAVLRGYGALTPAHKAQLDALAARVVSRAVQAVTTAASIDDDGVEAVLGAILRVNAVMGLVDADTKTRWMQQLQRVAEVRGTHPRLAGVATSIEEVDGDLGPDGFARRLDYFVGSGAVPRQATAFLEGLLAYARQTHVQSGLLLRHVDGLVQRLWTEEFVALLPVLRRTFAGLSPAERSAVLSKLGRSAQTSEKPPSPAEAADPETALAAKLDALAASVWKDIWND